MKIEGNRPAENQEIRLRSQKPVKQGTTPAAVEGQPGTGRKDEVHLSGKARQIEELTKVIQQMPEMRTDKIEELKKSIEEGRYKVDSFQIAGKILEEI
jgi:negative regulator of flagellin synthesis FlgM